MLLMHGWEPGNEATALYGMYFASVCRPKSIRKNDNNSLIPTLHSHIFCIILHMLGAKTGNEPGYDSNTYIFFTANT